MGLFDDPLGTFFGGPAEEGVLDRRVNREPEGQRWWDRWEQTYGAGGPMDPMSVYPKAMAALDQLMGFSYAPSYGQQLGGTGGGGGGGLLNYQQPEYQRAPAGFGPPNYGPDAVVLGPGGAYGVGGLQPEPNLPLGMEMASGASPNPEPWGVPGFSMDDVLPPAMTQGPNNLPGGNAAYRSGAIPMELNSGTYGMASSAPGMDAPAGTMPGLMSRTLKEAPVRVRMGGNEFSITPRWARELPFSYAAAVGKLMDPWYGGGMELERGRLGDTWRDQSTGGFFGTFGDAFAGSFGESMGKGAAGGLMGP